MEIFNHIGLHPNLWLDYKQCLYEPWIIYYGVVGAALTWIMYLVWAYFMGKVSRAPVYSVLRTMAGRTSSVFVLCGSLHFIPHVSKIWPESYLWVLIYPLLLFFMVRLLWTIPKAVDFVNTLSSPKEVQQARIQDLRSLEKEYSKMADQNTDYLTQLIQHKIDKLL